VARKEKVERESKRGVVERELFSRVSKIEISCLNSSTGGGRYTLEYVLTRVDGRKVRNLAVVAARRGELLTLTALAPEEVWASGGEGGASRKKAALRRLVDSFHLL